MKSAHEVELKQINLLLLEHPMILCCGPQTIWIVEVRMSIIVTIIINITVNFIATLLA